MRIAFLTDVIGKLSKTIELSTHLAWRLFLTINKLRKLQTDGVVLFSATPYYLISITYEHLSDNLEFLKIFNKKIAAC